MNLIAAGWKLGQQRHPKSAVASLDNAIFLTPSIIRTMKATGRSATVPAMIPILTPLHRSIQKSGQRPAGGVGSSPGPD